MLVELIQTLDQTEDVGKGDLTQCHESTQGEGSETQYDKLILPLHREPDTTRAQQVREEIQLAVVSTGLGFQCLFSPSTLFHICKEHSHTYEQHRQK